MKDYKRLTEEHINDAEFCSGCSFDDDLNGCEIGGCDKYYMYFETYEKLRKLEDKIESGELCDREEVIKKTTGEILKKDGASEDFIQKNLTESAVRCAIKNGFSPDSLAWSLLQ